MPVNKLVIAYLLLIALAFTVSAQNTRHPLTIDDLFNIRNVSDPQVSPDGMWVAYVVGKVDTKADKSGSDIWMVSFDGKTDRQLTFTIGESESSPKWSPDGKYLSFVSSRPGPNKGSQI